MKWNREQTEKYFVLFGKIMLVAAIVFNTWLTHKCYFNFLLSDDASELVYSRMLAQEGSIISSNWYGSTELEILNTQLIYSLLFHFTSNFQVVRIVGQVILTLIFLASYLFCLRGIDPGKAGERFWKTAFLLVIPISDAWIFLIMKAYYIPAVAVSFVGLGLACRIRKEEVSKKRKLVLLVTGCIFAFVACLEGLRHIQLTYLPLVLSFVWIWWNLQEENGWTGKKLLLPRGTIASVCWLVSGMAGYLVNVLLLSKIYQYDTHQDAAFQDQLPMESIQNTFNALLQVTGYSGWKELVSGGGICNALAIVFAVVIIVSLLRIAVRMRTRKTGEQLVSAFVILSFLLSMFIYISVNDVQARWVMAGVAPMVLFLVLMERLPALKQYVLLTVCYGTIAMLGAHEYKLIYTSDQNEELREVYNLLMDSDYTFGYATFRAGNLMTELTNGKVDMRIVQAYAPNHKLKNRHWLTPIEFEYHEGTFPLILDKERTEGTFDPQDDWKLILDTEAYWVYEIPDQRAFQEYLDKVEL